MNQNPTTNIYESKKSKSCSCCRKALNLEKFYSKGNRYDSRCKNCVSKLKAAHYKNKRAKNKSSSRISVDKKYQLISTISGILTPSTIARTSETLGYELREVI